MVKQWSPKPYLGVRFFLPLLDFSYECFLRYKQHFKQTAVSLLVCEYRQAIWTHSSVGIEQNTHNVKVLGSSPSGSTCRS